MLRRAAVPPFTHAVSLLANMPCRRVGARDEHVPLTLEERAPMQAQGPLHLCVTQGRQTLKTPFTDLLLGKRRGSRRHRRRRRKCLLLGWRHVQRTKRSEEPRLENDGEEAEEMRVAATPSKKFRRLEGDTAVTKLRNTVKKLRNSFEFLSRLRTVFIFICPCNALQVCNSFSRCMEALQASVIANRVTPS